MDIFTLAGSQSELKLMLLEMIQQVLLVNFAVISTVTLIVCLSNLLLNVRADNDRRARRRF